MAAASGMQLWWIWMKMKMNLKRVKMSGKMVMNPMMKMKMLKWKVRGHVVTCVESVWFWLFRWVQDSVRQSGLQERARACLCANLGCWRCSASPNRSPHATCLPDPAEVVSLLRELAAGLEDEGAEEGEDGESGEGEDDGLDLGPAVTGAVGVQWRQAYLGSTQPPLTLGPVCVKQAAGGCWETSPSF